MTGKGAVWLASYPKSGNTWMRLLLANLIVPQDRPVPINQIELPSHRLMLRSVVEDMTLIDTSLLTRSETERLRPGWAECTIAQATERGFTKTHDHYRRNDAGQGIFGAAPGMSAVYVVRDPRDVVISLAHHVGGSVDEAIELLNRDMRHRQEPGCHTRRFDEAWSSWSEHVRGWLDQADMPVHCVRYEDLLADTSGAFAAVAHFLGLDAPAGELQRAVDFASFDQVRRQEQANGFKERMPRSTAPFFRSGRAGGWREALSAQQQARIVEANRQVMTRLGYL